MALRDLLINVEQHFDTLHAQLCYCTIFPTGDMNTLCYAKLSALCYIIRERSVRVHNALKSPICIRLVRPEVLEKSEHIYIQYIYIGICLATSLH